MQTQGDGDFVITTTALIDSQSLAAAQGLFSRFDNYAGPAFDDDK
ncbi:hypothetical protein [Aeromonas sp. DNP9]|jgi:hypothetical protein|nr:hypothetical protein [Aeromonas sp. DNP9]